MAEPITYLDFEVNIHNMDENTYSVRVISQGGRAESRFIDPFSSDKRMISRQTLTSASLRTSARVRSSSAAEIETMKELGASLFENTFSDQVKEFYYHCLGQAPSSPRVCASVWRSTRPWMTCPGSSCFHHKRNFSGLIRARRSSALSSCRPPSRL